MRAIVVSEHGGLDKLELREIDPPEPAPGEVRVRLHAASVNHLDLWVRRGIAGVRYPLPLVPGCDGAGVVDAWGAGVSDLERGARVVLQPGVSCGHCAACLAGNDHHCRLYGILGEHRDGTHAELVTVPRLNVIRLPEALDFETAAAFPLTFLTAWHMAVERARIQPGEDVLVHAGASGVGSAAVQIARLLGARVITTAGSAEKVAPLRELGAEHVILYRESDLAQETRKLTGKRGVDVILDHVGLETWEANCRSLARGGRLVVCGATSGHEVPTNLRLLFFKNLSFLGSTMGSKSELLRILPLIERGALRPLVDRVLPLREIRRAHELLEHRAAVGKIVLRID
ncbi:MAG: zinc-binding dehydrogenase [Candidatus Latescibacterota bacterium]|nr:MAG: zinc-binding dehydrogenase [Candidatus Latescibacterota bacterium]